MSGSGTRLRKRLFLNLDGTGQSEYTLEAHKTADGKLTSQPVSNIARIGRATVTDDEAEDFQQIVYYLAGVGASSEDSVFAKGYQGLTGLGLVQNVREAYGFLCNNYDYGDEIYITGFSRGAFTARSVAGMIGKVGILTKKGLELFYEAFDYYENPAKWGNKSPVAEPATTRIHIPGSNDVKIKIKAVGVFDTVGALSGDFAFHDVELGEHIEHAYHALSLNEKRGYFGPTLWESPQAARSYDNFEQCWMVGDHSNVGGSWPDQQLADISLAWMMSRFEALGVKYNEGYLFDEYTKYKKRVDAKANPPNPRQWGQGKCQELDQSYLGGWINGPVVRTPGMYKKPVWTTNWRGNSVLTGGAYLENTNETVHPCARYRHFCMNPRGTGPEDKGTYDPKALDGWTWPSRQKDGRIGGEQAGSPSSPSSMEYGRNRDGKSVTMRESVLGRYEKILLALYDQDHDSKGRESVWKQVLGGTPPRDIQDIVAALKAA